MRVEFYLNNIEEISINNVFVVDVSGSIKERMKIDIEKQVWYAELDIEIDMLTYKFWVNNNFYINDYYANYYKLIDGQVWSVRCIPQSKNLSVNSKGLIKYLNSIVSNQVTESNYLGIEKHELSKNNDEKANVGIECNVLGGLHEVCLLWISPNKVQIYTSYGIIQPEKDSYEYKVFIWFQLLFEHIDNRILEGEWKYVIILDGKLVKEESFIVR